MTISVVSCFLGGSGGSGTAPATDSALVRKSAGQTVTTTPVALAWGAEEYDRTNWHDTVTNNSRLNVVSGVTLARVITNSQSGSVLMEQKKNGSSFAGKGLVRATNNGSANPGTNATSAIIPVTGGTDYFETFLNTASGNITPSTENWTWSFIEKLEAATSYCFCQLTSNEATNNGTATIINWDTAAGTKGSWWSGANPSRITPDVTLVRVTGNIYENNLATNTRVRPLKNGVAARGMPSWHNNSSANDRINFASAPIVMNGTTDYIEIEVLTTGASSILTDDASWFQVEEVPSTYKRALGYKTTNQNLPSAVEGAIYLDATAYDTDSILQTITSTVTITIASPGVVSWVAHGLNNGAPIKLSTTGALPTGLTAGTIYYVVNKAADTFQLAATPGGTAINTSGSQSGTHTATNKSRMLAPAGVTQARVTWGLSLSASTSGVDFGNTSSLGWVRKNDGNWYGMPLTVTIANAGVRSLSGVSAWVDVTASTDYFELRSINHSQARDVVADEYTFLCVEFR